jgi:hypothetical protein
MTTPEIILTRTLARYQAASDADQQQVAARSSGMRGSVGVANKAHARARYHLNIRTPRDHA